MPTLSLAEPLQRLRNQLRSVVHPQHLRRPAGRGEHRSRAPSTSRSAVIERSTMFSSDSRVCSSIIDAILIALPSTVESNWKSIAHTTFGASAIDRRDRGHPGPLTRAVHPHLQALLTPQPVDLLLVDLTALVVAQRRPGAPEPMARVFGGVGSATRPASRRQDRQGSAPSAGVGRWSGPAQRPCTPTAPTCSTSS